MQLSARFVDAIRYAAEAHGTQVRKGTSIPYLSHLLSVAALALEYGADEDEAIAAILHDVVEDTGGVPRVTEITAAFGDRVTAIVLGCTDTNEQPKPPWRERKARYIEHLRTADPSTRLVSACDKLHNMRSIAADLRRQGNLVWEKFAGKREGSLWYYTSIVEVLQTPPLPHGLGTELQRILVQLETLSASAPPLE